MPPTRTPVSAADRSALERAFGGGGKVYVKNRDEEFGSGMGGKGKKNKSGTATPMLPAPVVAPPPAVKQIVPPPPVLPSPAQMQSSASSLQKKEKSPVTTGSGGRNTNGNGNSSEELVEISDEAAKALLEIESAVASLSSKVKGKSVVRECFCAGSSISSFSLTSVTPYKPFPFLVQLVSTLYRSSLLSVFHVV